MEVKRVPTLTGLSHIDLTVSDLDRADAWYTRLFGLARVLEGEDTERGFKVRYYTEPTSQFVLGLVEHRDGRKPAFNPRVVGLDHLSFGVRDRDELAAWKVKLDDLGIANDGISEQGVGAGLNFVDPDGIALEFYVLDGVPPAR